jgi:hypothetical protein
MLGLATSAVRTPVRSASGSSVMFWEPTVSMTLTALGGMKSVRSD